MKLSPVPIQPGAVFKPDDGLYTACSLRMMNEHTYYLLTSLPDGDHTTGPGIEAGSVLFAID